MSFAGRLYLKKDPEVRKSFSRSNSISMCLHQLNQIEVPSVRVESRFIGTSSPFNQMPAPKSLEALLFFPAISVVSTVVKNTVLKMVQLYLKVTLIVLRGKLVTKDQILLLGEESLLRMLSSLVLYM